MSTAATQVNSTAAASSRLRLDLDQLCGHEEKRVPALDRLEAAVGRGLVQRLLAELSERDLRRLEAALSPQFAERITSLLADERSGTTEHRSCGTARSSPSC